MTVFARPRQAQSGSRHNDGRRLKQDVAMMVVAADSAGNADPSGGKPQRDWRTSYAGKRRR
jgi:hypothetical protein